MMKKAMRTTSVEARNPSPIGMTSSSSPVELLVSAGEDSSLLVDALFYPARGLWRSLAILSMNKITWEFQITWEYPSR